MKALLLGSSNSRNAGGIFHTMQALGHQLHTQGADVHYLLHDDEHSAADRASYAPLPLHTYAIKGPRNLAYSPDTITAAEGDVVSFKFGSGHNVVSGSFDSPCQPDGTIYSGEGSDGDVFSVTINGTDPIWLYCSVPYHCESGMAMVINAP